jgi:hypothetical protein
MSKRTIRLTESDLHRVIKESVNTILKEFTNPWGYSEYDNDDMTYENVYDNAEHKIISSYKRGKIYSNVHDLIEDLYVADSFNQSDYETVYDDCEYDLNNFDYDN